MTVLVGVTLLMQLAAALQAFRLTKTTGNRAAWLLIAGATLLMAVERALTFVGQVTLDSPPALDAPAQLVALAVSVALLVGLGSVAPFIRSVRRAEHEVRQLLESAPDAMVIADKEDRITQVNAETVRLFGHPRERLVGSPVDSLIPERFRARHNERRAEYHKRPRHRVLGYDAKVTGLKADGSEFPVEVSVGPLETADGMMVVSAIRDVTRRWETEEALRESEGRFRSLLNDVLDNSSVAVCILDAQFQIVWVNRAFESYFELNRRDVVGYDGRRLVEERLRYVFDNPKDFGDRVLTAYENNTYVEQFECHVLPEDGRKELWLDHWSQPIETGLYRGGRIEQYADVTERKKADQRIQLFGRIARNMQIGLLVYHLEDLEDDRTLRIIALNPEGEKLLGVPHDDVMGRLIDEVFPEVRKRGNLPRVFADVIRTGESRVMRHYEYGDNRVLEDVWSLKAFRLPEQSVGVVFERVTDRVRTEELVQNLAAGVAGASGEEFFRSLVLYLAKSLDLEYAFVGELDEIHKTSVNTIAVCEDGKITENMTYDLAGTPCADVMGKRPCVHVEGVQQRFPEDHLLVEMRVESYLGAPLFDSTGEAMGLIAVLGRKPLRNPETAQSVLEIFAARAAAEVERRRAEQTLRGH